MNGNGDYTTPVGYVPVLAGTYFWVASYSGDVNNLGVTSGVRDEPVVISPATPAINTTATPTIETVGGPALKDEAASNGSIVPEMKTPR